MPSSSYHIRRPSAGHVLRFPIAGGLMIAALAAGGLSAQDATATRLPADTQVRVDGLLSEPFWANARVIDDFRTREPEEGGMPTERTEVRIVWDADNLYVGVMAFDSEPDRVVARLRQRDKVMSARGYGGASFAGDDGIALLLDPFDDDRNGIILATNANGAQFDALLTDEGGQINVDWQGVWDVAGTRTSDGWSAEFAIPWRSIRYPAGADTDWGLNVFRSIPRKQEEILWRSWEREGGGFDRVSRAGSVGGLVDLPSAGANIEVKPFVLAGSRGERAADDLSYQGEFDAGLDMKAELRPGLVLDLTVNTDFAQVEVDNQQVNLTRFSLFFPERRDFFLENAGIFEFGRTGYGGGPPFLMFFSRRIGIGSDGPVPILGGGRLTGRVGNQTVGFLSVATDEVSSQGREIFNVARVKRDIGESGYIGAMVTDRRGDGSGNTVAGLDGLLRLNSRIVAEAFAARSHTEGEGGEGNVLAGSMNYTTDLQGGFLQLLSVDEGMNTRSGFVARRDFRSAQINLRQSMRPDFAGIRKIDLRVNNEWGWTTGGDFQERQWGPSLRFDFESGDDLNFSYNFGDSQVDDPFTLADSLAVGVGRYAVDGWSIRAGTSSARSIRLSANVERKDFYDGSIETTGGGLTWAPNPAITLEPQFRRSHVTIPTGEFTADISSMRLTWAFSPKMTTTAFVQHNSLNDQIVTNVRFNFIHRPGSDLFLVFSDDRVNLMDEWVTEDRGLLMKLTWLMRM